MTTLAVSTCEQRAPHTYSQLFSFLLSLLSLSLSLLIVVDMLANFRRRQRPAQFAPRAFYFKGTMRMSPHYIYANRRIYFRKAPSANVLQDIYSFNGTCRRGLNSVSISSKLALRRYRNAATFQPARININHRPMEQSPSLSLSLSLSLRYRIGSTSQLTTLAESYFRKLPLLFLPEN